MSKQMKIGLGIAVLLILAVGGYYFFRQNQGNTALASIKFTSPAGGESWAVGSIHKINWDSNKIPAGNKVAITIRRIPPPALQTEGQEFDPILITNLDNTGSIDWTIADMYPAGNYVLGINSYASLPATNTITAESKQFEITRPEVIGGQKDEHGCLVGAGYSWCEDKETCIRQWEEYCTSAKPKTVVFGCKDFKSITATFYPKDDKFVDLVLSDERKMTLLRAISASGARYVKPDESFVFWNKGDTAFITENSTTTFADCAIAETK